MVQRYFPGFDWNEDSRGEFVAYTDYAALEAERDEWMMAARAEADIVDELAKRMRAARRWLADELLDLNTAELDAIFDGPVPECRACAEMRGLVAKVNRVMTGKQFYEYGVINHPELPQRTLAMDVRDFLARHAADEGGGHE